MGREPLEGELRYLVSELSKTDWFGDVNRLLLSNDGVENELRRSMDLHLHLIHAARLKMVKRLLPPGEVILDLGGAAAPLYRLGYPYPFKKLFVIDLPEDLRHESFRDVSLERTSDGGEIILRYADMTDLSTFGDETVDLVWSGQSIEHVNQIQGVRMCTEAYRILKPGGSFCLDTPNRLITELHTRSVGGGLIHPDHKIEYTPGQLREMLTAAGFNVVSEFGICEMPLTTLRGEFTYEDFVVGGPISLNPDRSYIQYFHCRK
jgi:predicted SAM-dependent methyltransferase